MLPYNPNDARGMLEMALQALPPALAYQIRLLARQMPMPPGWQQPRRPLAFGTTESPRADAWWDDPAATGITPRPLGVNPDGTTAPLATRAEEMALAGESVPGPLLAGGGGAAGPGSVNPTAPSPVSGATPPTLDEAARAARAADEAARAPESRPGGGPLPAATTPPGGTLARNPNGLSFGGGIADLGREQQQRLYENPSLALQMALADMGIDVNRNRFGQMAMQRYAGSADLLTDIMQALNGDGPGTHASDVMGGLMRGTIDAGALVHQAIDQGATGNDLMAEILNRAGPGAVVPALSAGSRGAPGVTQARERLMMRRLRDLQAEQLRNPVEDDANAWLALLRS